MRKLCERNVVAESRVQKTKDWLVIAGARWILMGRSNGVNILIIERS